MPLAIGINVDFVSLLAEYDPKIYIGGDNNIFWKPMSWAIIYGLTFRNVPDVGYRSRHDVVLDPCRLQVAQAPPGQGTTMSPKLYPTLAITGITGFLGGHMALEALRRGHHVRGTLRSMERADAVRSMLAEHLGSDSEAALTRLTFHEADLLSSDGWVESGIRL